MLQLRSNVLRGISFNFSTTQIECFHSSCVLERRSGKRTRNVPEFKKDRFSQGPWWKKDDIIMTAPIAKTFHPENKFKDLEDKFLFDVEKSSCQDFPVDIEDPYNKEPKMCVLCPRKYSEPILPNYKNPKLLSQFVSPHTGRVYQSHITGLCTYMQDLVEREVKRSRAAGLMSTRVRDPAYLQDPSLFNPGRPIKPNPY